MNIWACKELFTGRRSELLENPEHGDNMLMVLCLATVWMLYVFSVGWLISGWTNHADVWNLSSFMTHCLLWKSWGWFPLLTEYSTTVNIDGNRYEKYKWKR